MISNSYILIILYILTLFQSNQNSFRYSNAKSQKLEIHTETETLSNSLSIVHSQKIINKQRPVIRVMSEASSSDIVRPFNSTINDSDTLQSSKLKVRSDRSAMVLVSLLFCF